jgi:hypothetical protein
MATMEICIWDPHHSKKFMAFVQVRHDNALTFGNVPIGAHKHTIFPQGGDLIQRKLILMSKRSSRVHQHEQHPSHACV